MANCKRLFLLSAARVSAKSGLDIVFDESRSFMTEKGTYADGAIDIENNCIIINPKAKNRSGEMILIHELTHAIYNGKNGVLTVAKGVSKMTAEEKEAIRKRYKKVYSTDSRGAVLAHADEINAHLAEKTLKNKNILERLVSDKPSVKDRILSFFKKAVGAYEGDERLQGAAKKLYKQYKKLFDDFAARNFDNNAMGENQGGKRFAFAGENAATANKLNLANARKMLANGVDSETIRKETGWFKSYDGKWRFEIDDSEAHLIEKPLYEEHFDKDFGSYKVTYLDNILNHENLFKAYPELKNYRIIIQDMEPGVFGGFSNKSKDIVLSNTLFEKLTKEYEEYLNGSRLSEIAKIEATPEYQAYSDFYETDYEDAEAWLAEEKIVRDRFFSSELGKRYYQLRWGKVDIRKYEPGWSPQAKAVLLHEIQHAVQNIEGFATGANTKNKNYDSTAGEIEARDVADRVALTEEQRKNTQPDIDRQDVVFAENEAKWCSARDKEYDSERSTISAQLRQYQDELNKMDIVGSATVPTSFKSKNAVLHWATEALKATGYQVDKQGIGIVYFDSKDINNGLNYADTDAEKAAFAVLHKVIKRGRIIEQHSDHKNRGKIDPNKRKKQTITIAAPVELNGVRGNMAVVINRHGNHYYAHRILLPDGNMFVFSEIKEEARREPYRGVTENSSLANTTSLTSNNSIPQNADLSTPDGEKSNKKFALPDEDIQKTDGELYSYEALTAKKDMEAVTLAEDAPRSGDGTISRERVRLFAKANARKQNNINNTEKETYVYVPDIDKDVRISRKALDHGLAHSDDTALVTTKIGDILANSVAVNELNGRKTAKKETDMSYAMLGIGKNKNGTYIVRTIIDKNTNAVSEISSYGLYAVKAKKEGVIFTLKSDEGVETDVSVPYLDSTISIADFLEFVKGVDLASSVLSQNVLDKLGVGRGKNDFGSSLRYALSVDDVVEQTSRSISQTVTKPDDVDFSDKLTRIQIHFTNAQAGIEKYGKEKGNIETNIHDIAMHTAARIVSEVTAERTEYKAKRAS